jgi:hypothetical protein
VVFRYENYNEKGYIKSKAIQTLPGIHSDKFHVNVYGVETSMPSLEEKFINSCYILLLEKI